MTLSLTVALMLVKLPVMREEGGGKKKKGLSLGNRPFSFPESGPCPRIYPNGRRVYQGEKGRGEKKSHCRSRVSEIAAISLPITPSAVDWRTSWPRGGGEEGKGRKNLCHCVDRP